MNVRIEVESEVIVEDLHKGLLKVSSIDFYCDEKEELVRDAVQRLREAG